MRTNIPGINKLAMISIPVIIAVVLTLMLALAALWISLTPLANNNARAVPASNAAIAMYYGGMERASS